MFTAGHVDRIISLKSHFILLLHYLPLFSKTVMMKSNKDSFITEGFFIVVVEIPEQVSELQLLRTLLWHSRMGLHQVATSLLNWGMYFGQYRCQINK